MYATCPLEADMGGRGAGAKFCAGMGMGGGEEGSTVIDIRIPAPTAKANSLVCVDMTGEL